MANFKCSQSLNISVRFKSIYARSETMAMQAAELSVQTSDTALLSCLMLYCSHTDEDRGDS